MKKALRIALIGLMAAGLVLSVAGCGKKREREGFMQIRGSDTMLQLTTAWAENFMKANPKVQIAVTGGGSGTGIAAMINGTIDIAMASRKMKDKEADEAKANGINPMEHVVARDGISVIVNPANPLKELTQAQIADIYTGVITNWKDVGGSDHPITLVGRDNSSGTYEFFLEHVLEKEDYAKTCRHLQSNSAIVEEVSSNPYAIGYVGLGYLVGAGDKVVGLAVASSEGSPYVKPSEETVKNGTYGIARPLYFYTSGEPQGLVKAFLGFVESEEGQRIVRDEGFVPVK
jgi:phosphate transport system substrate-binding protein